ncbi:hypothetical protein [Propioniciclava flava]
MDQELTPGDAHHSGSAQVSPAAPANAYTPAPATPGAPFQDPDPSCLRAARVWREGRLLHDRVGVNEIVTLVHDPSVLVWVDLVAPTEAELVSLARRLSLPATAVEDALGPKSVPNWPGMTPTCASPSTPSCRSVRRPSTWKCRVSLLG